MQSKSIYSRVYKGISTKYLLTTGARHSPLSHFTHVLIRSYTGQLEKTRSRLWKSRLLHSHSIHNINRTMRLIRSIVRNRCQLIRTLLTWWRWHCWQSAVVAERQSGTSTAAAGPHRHVSFLPFGFLPRRSQLTGKLVLTAYRPLVVSSSQENLLQNYKPYR